jgi:hypothetical protein
VRAVQRSVGLPPPNKAAGKKRRRHPPRGLAMAQRLRAGVDDNAASAATADGAAAPS